MTKISQKIAVVDRETENEFKRMRNREHARNSRQRKADRLNQLELENRALREANMALQEANNRLQEQLLSDCTTLFNFS